MTQNFIMKFSLSRFIKDSGIVYCFSRKECDDVAQTFRLNQIKAEAYHAGLSDSERARIQTKWITDKTKVTSTNLQ